MESVYGNLILDNLSAAGDVDVSGNLYGTDIYANNLYQFSDSRFKSDIRPVESATGTIKKLKPVTYRFTGKNNGKAEKKASKVAGADGRSTGFLAQEVAQVLPNSVAVDENGDYLVDYISMIPLLVKTIQEQEARIAKLEQQLNSK